jgi:hypothetical protein
MLFRVQNTARDFSERAKEEPRNGHIFEVLTRLAYNPSVKIGITLGLVGLLIVTPVLVVFITVAFGKLVPVGAITILLPSSLMPMLFWVIEYLILLSLDVL